MSGAAILERSIARTDFIRRAVVGSSRTSGFKEWWHFAVVDEGLTLLVNLSLMADPRASAPAGSELARVACLVRCDGVWEGDIDVYTQERVHASGGRMSLRLGNCHAELRDSAFRLSVELKQRPVAVDLSLLPLALPTQVGNVSIQNCPPLNWLVVPRLSASGTLRLGDRVIELDDAPAYHDHNWGSFRWGKNFGWEWGYGVPRARGRPFSLVFTRFTDRARSSAVLQALLLWKGRRIARAFEDEQITVERRGLLRASNVFKLPRSLGALVRATSTDVPAELVARAESGGDALELRFTARDLAQIVVPNDDDLGFTVINEVSGRLQVEGSVGGEHVHLDEPSNFEFLGD